MSVDSLPTRPRSVRWALIALLASCLLDLVVGVGTIIAALAGSEGVSPSVTVGIVVSGLIPLALLTVIARGRRWALVVFALLIALDLLTTIASLQMGVDAGWWRVVYRVAYLALAVGGITLLLMPDGRGWFATCRSARRGEGAGA